MVPITRWFVIDADSMVIMRMLVHPWGSNPELNHHSLQLLAKINHKTKTLIPMRTIILIIICQMLFAIDVIKKDILLLIAQT